MSEQSEQDADTDHSVLIVSQHFPPDNSGNASRVRDTAVYLDEFGFDVTVIAPPPAFPHGQFEQRWYRKEQRTHENIRVIRLWSWVPTEEDPSFLGRLMYYLTFPLHTLLWLLFSVRKYDIVLTSSPPIFTGIPGFSTLLSPSTSWVVDVRDLWIDASIGLGFIDEGGVVERISRIYEQTVLRRATCVLVTTSELGSRLVQQYQLDPECIVHIPNGVDTTEFDTSEGADEPLIVYTGNVGHAQDLESCTRAMKGLEHPDATLKIVGDGDIRDELESLVETLEITDRVEFTGLVPRTEIPAILDEAAIGIAPLKDQDTLEYAVPTKAYEYMAAELPVVATGTGELERLLEKSEGGVIVDNDPEEVADVFSRLLQSEDRREDMGSSGREHIQANYDRRSIARKLGEALDSLV